MADLTKVCPGCGADKVRADFRRNAARPDGLSFYCRACFKVIDKAAYKRRRESKGFTVRPRAQAPPGWKWCPDCDDYRQHSEFPRNAASRDGWHSYCKVHHLERGKRDYYRRKYGLTVNKVQALADRQAGVCAICLRPLAGKLHVDHDHATGEIRGLLCFNCNGGLGQFRDDPWALERARDYLVGELVAPVKIAPGVYDVAGLYSSPGA